MGVNNSKKSNSLRRSSKKTFIIIIRRVIWLETAVLLKGLTQSKTRSLRKKRNKKASRKRRSLFKSNAIIYSKRFATTIAVLPIIRKRKDRDDSHNAIKGIQYRTFRLIWSKRPVLRKKNLLIITTNAIIRYIKVIKR